MPIERALVEIESAAGQFDRTIVSASDPDRVLTLSRLHIRTPVGLMYIPAPANGARFESWMGPGGDADGKARGRRRAARGSKRLEAYCFFFTRVCVRRLLFRSKMHEHKVIDSRIARLNKEQLVRRACSRGIAKGNGGCVVDEGIVAYHNIM